jgi:hypothetical protein
MTAFAAASAQFQQQFAKLRNQILDLEARTTGSVFHHDMLSLAETFAETEAELDYMLSRMPENPPAPPVSEPTETGSAPPDGTTAVPEPAAPPVEEPGSSGTAAAT